MLAASRLGHRDDVDVHQLAELCPLPAAVINLTTRRLAAISPQLMLILGLREQDPEDVAVRVLVDDPTVVDTLLDLVVDRTISSYESRRSIRQANGFVSADNWVTANHLRARDLALWIMAPDGQDPGQQVSSPAPSAWPQRVPGLVVGTLDAALAIEQVSTDIEALTGYTPDEVMGRPFPPAVHPEDRPDFYATVARALADRGSVGVELRLSHRAGGWYRSQLVVAPLACDQLRLGVVLTPPPLDEQAERVRAAQLEQHLWRIASEVEAAGVLSGYSRAPDPRQHPGLKELTGRQWEILQRLLDGERVPTIAKRLFLSQSTVRNHLSSIFGQLGVSSQPELLELLRGDGEDRFPSS